MSDAKPQWLAERPVQLKGQAWARALLGLFGWRTAFEGLPAHQGVLVAYPHTSNWDFVVGILTRWAIGVPVVFWGKDSLFKVPLFGRWLRWIGGIPVDRRNPTGIVDDMVARFERAQQQGDTFWLALAPEGTRARQDFWRSGFYRVTVRSQVPLGLAFFDYPRKRVGVTRFVRLCGEPAADMAAIASAYADVQGARPEQASPIALKP